ncbi:DEAD/DEAH box helicase [Verrucomicrobia bacterium]|nr:DEAD/DEAH box helicase [Verrucomicrobiota bacterium]
MKFTELNLRPDLLKSLKQMGYEDLTPIQEESFQPIMDGKDIVGLAETGSGKTSACGIPLAQIVDPAERTIQALVLVPTRELALQYVDEINRLTANSDIECFAVFGGFPMEIQVAKLRDGVHILVATPGRLIDFIYNSDELSLKNVKTLVLDEADEMLNMGFWDDVKFILDCITSDHQSLLFSATMPNEIEKLIQGFLKDPVTIKLISKRKAPQSLEHFFMSVNPRDRVQELIKYLESEDVGQVILFCNSRHGTSDVVSALRGKLKSIELIHGGLSQNVRTSIFNRFKSGKIKYMVATDVAGRGLDFSKVTHVVNFDMPRELENYTHRTGRAGRMGRKGTALTMITRRDLPLVARLEKKGDVNMNWIGEKPDSSEGHARPRPSGPHRPQGGGGNRNRRPRKHSDGGGGDRKPSAE